MATVDVVPLPVPPSDAIWVPQGTTQSGTGRKKVLMVVSGDSGAGKSHLIRQLCQDSRYGPKEVLVGMAEDSTATYGDPLPARFPVTNVASLEAKIKEMQEAIRRGARLPKLFCMDSLTGLSDFQFDDYSQNPDKFKSWSSAQKEMVKNEFAKYGDFGDLMRRVLLLLRNALPMDVIVLATTYTPAGGTPEYAIPGNIVPHNLTRWTDCCLFLKPEPVTLTIPAEDLQQKEAAAIKEGKTFGLPNVMFDRDDSGKLNGKALVRYLYSQPVGEVLAKGHRNLRMREPAYLPDILARIRDEQTPTQEAK